jgi:hypothetical protein
MKVTMFSQCLTFLLAAVGIANADWQYRSRPDLAPPRLNITIPATEDTYPGYLFVAPFAGFPEGTRHGPLQPGAYIFTDKGELVWSGYTYFSIWATNFQAGRWKGKDILFSFEGAHNAAYGHGHGHTTFLNQHYETIRELRAGNHRLTDKHEFHIIGEETGLIQIYHPVPRDLTAFGASSEQQWIVDSRFQELDIETGKVLFEWSSLDHVSPHESVLPITQGQAGAGFNSSDAWDYFHINSVDKDQDGNYLISARDACAVYKINGLTGDIIWKLAGKNSTFDLDDDVDFCFQHHARYLTSSEDGTRQTISLYDNSAHGTESNHGSEVKTYEYSRGKILEVDTENRQAHLVAQYIPPDGLLSKSQGSTQVLPNGNVLVNWGSEGAVTEYLANGTAIFHAYMDSDQLGVGVQNYRGFKYQWTGLPNEDPAVVAYNNKDTTTIYVSWNGDTETKVWRFYGTNSNGALKQYLGEAVKEGFETSFTISGDRSYFQVEALDESGNILRSSSVIRSSFEEVELSKKLKLLIQPN